jgi:hypothetical protein
MHNIADGHWAWEPAHYESCVFATQACEALSVVSVIHGRTYQYIPAKYAQMILRFVPHPQHSRPHALIPSQSTHNPPPPTHFSATNVSMLSTVIQCLDGKLVCVGKSRRTTPKTDTSLGVSTFLVLCNQNTRYHHHKHQGLDPLIRSVTRVTTALANVFSVFQLFSFLVTSCWQIK